jgi:hypothetical protein
MARPVHYLNVYVDFTISPRTKPCGITVRHRSEAKAMKITDPSGWPPGFAPLHFLPCPAHTAERAFVVITAHGEEVAELVMLDHADGDLVLDEPQNAAIPLAGAWGLALIDSDGRVLEEHVLCAIDERPGETAHPSEGVLAWVAATLFWAVAAGERGHG